MQCVSCFAVSGLILLYSCDSFLSGKEGSGNALKFSGQQEKTKKVINPDGKTIAERFNTPDGYERVAVSENSFGDYLRHIPLKAHGTQVKLYDGSPKSNHIYEAVIDMDIGKKDLQQCADAIMRLRAEYFFHRKEYDSIHFNFTNGFRVDYSKWAEGYRVTVDGSRTSWVKRAEPSTGYAGFRDYMEIVFSYAGSLSLSKELQPVSIENLAIGDVFIRGGSPGHAVMVMDVAENKTTKEKIFLLAQSYMPAQDIHVLTNLNDAEMNPWYSTSFGDELYTPEWTFSKDELRRFAE